MGRKVSWTINTVALLGPSLRSRLTMIANEEAKEKKRAPGFVRCLILGLAAICAVNLSWVATAAAAPAVFTEEGLLKGVSIHGVNEYLGIPYAAPPVGALRWTPPQPHNHWHGLFAATQFGEECVVPGAPDQTTGSEDCLFLNVYAPVHPLLVGHQNQTISSRGLPVMVWIHGASTGSSLFDPRPLVEKGTVVVTINYRVGILGFFAHPVLDTEGHLNANYGLMDQQFALKWVKKNIANFAGDPNRVTIFGTSLGGLSVYSNLASPTAAGLFQRAIAESGSFESFADYLGGIVPIATAETAGTAFATTVGCSNQTPACLRGKPASALVEAQPANISPIVDGTVLTQPPGSAFASGEFNRVPVISGTSHDEWRFFVASQYDFAGNPLSAAGYLAAMEDLWTTGFGDFLANNVYLLGNYPSASIALSTSGTDGIFSCPARHADQSLAKYVPIYSYEFNDENAPSYPGFPAASFPLGAYHGSEALYLFIVGGVAAPFTPDQQNLSETMVGYWTRFAASANPNFVGAPEWLPYDPQIDQFQSLIPPTPAVESTFAADHLCSSLWDFI